MTIANVVTKVAARCNLNCDYCYLYNHEDRSTLGQPRWMGDQVFEALLRRMASHSDAHGHRMTMTLHGGEPTLIGPDRLKALVMQARMRLGERLGGVSIQTNATLVDARMARLLKQLELSVGVSMDGPAAIHDRHRLTHAGAGSHASTVRGVRTLRDAGVPVRILCVVDPGGDGRAAYRYFRELGADWIDFLLPDVSHDNRQRMYGDAPHPVADFLIPALEEWLREGDPSVFVPIFWDLFARLMGSRRLHSDYFGNPPMTYVIVNTDGSIEPLDALKVCDGGITQTRFNVLRDEFDDLVTEPSMLADALTGSIGPCATCRVCRYGAVCAGGYLPHRYRHDNGFDNPSVWCADIQLLLDRIANTIEADSIAQGEAAAAIVST